MIFEINRKDAKFLNEILKWKLDTKAPMGRWDDNYIQTQIGVKEGYYKHLINLICEYNYLTDIVKVEEGQYRNYVYPIDYVTQEFVNGGGFVEVYEEMHEVSESENESVHIGKENERLLNDELKYKKTIRELQGKNRKLAHKNQIFNLIRHWQWLLSIAFWIILIILKYFEII